MLFFKRKNSIKLSEASKLYLDYCELEQEMNPRSIYQYDRILKWILNSFGDVKIEKIGEKHINQLRKEYKKRNLKPSFRALNFSVLRNLIRFCQDELRLNVISPDKVKRPKIPRRAVEYLTEKELKSFFNSIDKNSIGTLRFRALLSVLISTGCRISEALNLRVEEIDWKRKEVMIIGKGNKQRKLYFADWSIKCIKAYLKKRKVESKFIFNSRGKSHRWDRNDAQRNFRLYRQKSGITKNFSAHTIRHSFATLLMKKGVGLGHIQVLLGHSDIQTTSKHYLGILSDEEAKKAHEKGMDMSKWL